MFVDYVYERLFNEIGLEGKESQEAVLEYIFSLVRLGIDTINNLHKNQL